ncbi:MULTISPECIES: hypothetical protein [Enterobacteriaceae]|nr:hypothetical protein [Klebsiella pneumoniae]MED6004880.1 hypothetical protein [Klebsiella pneumoniae]MED6058306.1 hypothetical protein [Klebsiella pneumoniae]
MLTIDEKGVVVPTLTEIIDELSEGYREIYGQDINIAPDSQDGQRIGLEAQARKDAYDTLAYAIQMHDPQYALGKFADVIGKITGAKREEGKYTFVPDIKIVTDRIVNLKAGYEISDNNGNNWILENDLTLGAGENLVDFRSEFFGAISLPVGTFLEPKEIIFGVKTITSTKAPIEGRLGESTAHFMERRARKLAINNTHDREGIEASLIDLSGVLDALVLENNTNATDSNGVPAHSINAIVLGGSSEDIATTILKKIKGGGCGTFGAELFTIINYRGADRVINFDRPTSKDITVDVTLVRAHAQVDIDIDAIKDAIVAKQFKIGQDVVVGMLYCFPNNGTFYVKSIKVDGGDLVSIGIREIANIPRENISVAIE